MKHSPIPNRFKDNVALGTGGVAGIGRLDSEELLKEGARLAFSR